MRGAATENALSSIFRLARMRLLLLDDRNDGRDGVSRCQQVDDVVWQRTTYEPGGKFCTRCVVRSVAIAAGTEHGSRDDEVPDQPQAVLPH